MTVPKRVPLFLIYRTVADGRQRFFKMQTNGMDGVSDRFETVIETAPSDPLNPFHSKAKVDRCIVPGLDSGLQFNRS